MSTIFPPEKRAAPAGSTAGAVQCAVSPVSGQPCVPGQDCYLAQCAGEFCVAAVPDGQVCDEVADCLPGRRCEDGYCTVPFACAL